MLEDVKSYLIGLDFGHFPKKRRQLEWPKLFRFRLTDKKFTKVEENEQKCTKNGINGTRENDDK